MKCLGERIYGGEYGTQKALRESLHLIHNDDRVGDAVDLTTLDRLGGKEALEELDICRQDDRSIPILSEELQSGHLLIATVAFAPLLHHDLGVVLQDILFAKDFSEDHRCLGDDRGVGDDVDDPVVVVTDRHLKRPRHGGDGLTRSGGEREGVDAGITLCSVGPATL